MNPTAQLLSVDVRELIEAKRYRELREALGPLPPFDVAAVLDVLEPNEAAVAFRLLPRELAGEAFAELESEPQQAIIEALGDRASQTMLQAMDPDDRAALLDEMPDQAAKRLIDRLKPEDRRVTQQILGYPEESIGRLMTPDYVRLRPEWTIQQSLEHIRRFGHDAETVHWVYVIDASGRLIDDLHIRSILLADPNDTVREIMDDAYQALSAFDDQEQAARAMLDYDRTVLPVVDSTGVLLGIVTIDDVADVVEEEATEDIHLIGGVEALDDPYIRTGLADMLRKRGVPLVILFVVQVITIAILGRFEGALQAHLILAMLVPLMISCGGNTGTQAASLLIRAVSLREVAPGDWRRVAIKELVTGVILGIVLGVLGVGIVYLVDVVGLASTDEPMRVGVAVGVAVLGIVTWAALLGGLLPLVLERYKLDPATISSPLVATLMDISGVLIYLGVATAILSA
ncbi:MAG: magnesium transporter [Phycisphaerales bacterium]|nr:magnesium transporter [Phycisphaerales bacterium]